MADESEPVNQDKIDSLPDEGGEMNLAGEQPPQSSQAPETGPVSHALPVDDSLLGQDEIEKLLQSTAQPSPAVDESSGQPHNEPGPNPIAGEGDMSQGDVEYLLDQAEQALESIRSESGGELPGGAARFQLHEFAGAPASTENATLDLIRDVDLDLRIELGRTHMYLEDVLKLRKGSVVPLDKLAGDPVDIYVNGRLIARGEVLVLNDNFCVRVAELIAGSNSA